jgi:amidophosphoribosyltransferase
MTASDSDVVAGLLARAFPDTAGDPAQGELAGVIEKVVPDLAGAFSFVLMDASHLYGVRDPNGFRPLCLGRLGPAERPEGWVLASESPALDVIGATFERELRPGEMVTIGPDGVRSKQLFADDQVAGRLCIFEFVYFARPDSRLHGQEVHGARRRMGELLARQAPVDADMVMGVPDSGVPAAEGYAREANIPYGQGLVKNRYIGRTFIDPDHQSRVDTVRRKLNPLSENIKGKRLIVVDDSIVRSTTIRAVVGMLRDAGAAEVHLRISSPPFRWPCFYGIDTPRREELLAANMNVAEIADYLGADSLAYITLEHLKEAIGAGDVGFCDACLTGHYPVKVPVTFTDHPAEPVPGDPAGANGDGPTGSRRDAILQASLPGI